MEKEVLSTRGGTPGPAAPSGRIPPDSCDPAYRLEELCWYCSLRLPCALMNRGTIGGAFGILDLDPDLRYHARVGAIKICSKTKQLGTNNHAKLVLSYLHEKMMQRGILYYMIHLS
jgi:hypothetical protein